MSQRRRQHGRTGDGQGLGASMYEANFEKVDDEFWWNLTPDYDETGKLITIG
jgi:hypothetical protein